MILQSILNISVMVVAKAGYLWHLINFGKNVDWSGNRYFPSSKKTTNEATRIPCGICKCVLTGNYQGTCFKHSKRYNITKHLHCPIIWQHNMRIRDDNQIFQNSLCRIVDRFYCSLNIIITYICDKHHEQRPQQIYILKLRFILIVVSRNEMKRKQSGTPFNKKKQN